MRIQEENPVYVGFVMNSIIGRLQTEQIRTGTPQAELYPKDIENFLIPFISKDKQEEVTNYYISSLKLKETSHQILEIAKIGVEKAIESDETTATAWINQQLAALGINSLDE